jgi:hypothetical protein
MTPSPSLNEVMGGLVRLLSEAICACPRPTQVFPNVKDAVETIVMDIV